MTTIQSTEIVSEMKRAYLDYAMSVIVSRALPDVRDGLKPVHRRILYAMYKMNLTAGARFSKSAKIVGEVLGKYHPHGDSPVYEALVRMAQDFTMRYQLVKGQGNFGSIDGDPAAHMRYTEAKLTSIAEEILTDIEKETVSFVDNFDGSIKEPEYLPSRIPNLLLMGAEGIAVGMATKIPPHNLSELADALICMIDSAKENKEEQKTENAADEITSPAANRKVRFETTTDELLKFVKGPDFPTRGTIYGAADIKQVYASGRGKILIRAKVDEEEVSKNRSAIVVTELPYQVNKAKLVSKIASLAVDKKVTGIADLRDESDREGIRVVIELKRDASYRKVLNNLFKFTDLQTTFPVNMVTLVDGVPQTLGLKPILEHYMYHRIDVIVKRSEFELAQAKKRAHILEGYLIALDHIDEVIEVIRKSKDEPEAKTKLMTRFKLSDLQAQAILDMQLKRLTGLERDKIESELAKLRELIAYLEALIADVFKQLGVIKDELLEMKKKYGDARKTAVVRTKPGEISDEMLIEDKEVIVVLTEEGYVKQVPRETFKVQNRGGKGVSGIETKDSDNVYYITTAQTHDFVLFFTNKGRVFQTRVWEIPQGSRTSKGKAIVNLLNIKQDEKVTSVLTYNKELADNSDNRFVLMITKHGVIKKTPFADYVNIRSNGIIAIRLSDTDELDWVRLTDGEANAILISKKGKAIVFKEQEVRPTGRSSQGVKGIELDGDDRVVSADVFTTEEFKKQILVISELGIGKRSKLSLFKGQHRGGKGVKIASLDKKTGGISYARIIEDEGMTVIITSANGLVVKIPLKSIPSLSRQAKGVILMRFKKSDDHVASATYI